MEGTGNRIRRRQLPSTRDNLSTTSKGSCSRRKFILILSLIVISVVSVLVFSWHIGTTGRRSHDSGPLSRFAAKNCSPLFELPPSLSSLLSRQPPVLLLSNSSESGSSAYPDCSSRSATQDNGTHTSGLCNLTETIKLLYGHKPQGALSSETPYQNRSCDVVPPTYVGAIRVHICKACIRDLDQLNFYVEPGGIYEPRDCVARSRAAIILPFRNRWEHLSEFLLNVHPLLQKQQLAYTIFVINQQEGSKFNRGMLLNIGSREASRIGNFSCYIFHDVDLLPENDKNVYSCPEAFRHYSVAVDKFRYRLPYNYLVGGVLAASTKAFQNVNGYSNLFFGWGGEDDDFSARITATGYNIERFSSDVSRYKMIKHDLDKGNELNPKRFDLLKTTDTRCKTDGLNSLVYRVDAIKYYKLFTMLDISISEQEVMNAFSGVASQPRNRR